MFRVAGTVKLALATLSLTIGFLSPALVHAKQAPEAVGTIKLAELPPQGRETYARVRQGGPFPYQKDGSVFGNRERLLPQQKRGYYLEYTVTTPGISNRGSRRIVCGGQPKVPDTCYYTADHYASFRKIVD
jgi:ribonuclease T1